MTVLIMRFALFYFLALKFKCSVEQFIRTGFLPQTEIPGLTSVSYVTKTILLHKILRQHSGMNIKIFQSVPLYVALKELEIHSKILIKYDVENLQYHFDTF
jgi:hypothetical protein